ncbi:uncharacterized protein LOC110996895 isoform X2 [Pieris rapae]|uniref:uncharacterized protein LOC110996895 isoform X2 n=1 Tax=Pieris rapae TaxID=64459 RepID=UPI001E27FEF2|nr:uncharacterized protein LOC110996895 isoform X2 [Pieris rapae]
MEPDSTTYDTENSKNETFPFSTGPCNISLYKDLVKDSGQGLVEMQIVERLQAFGLLPMAMECVQSEPTCELVCKTARVVDRVQWICKTCKKRQPIRSGSFFLKLQCSIVQALQMILAWCEDADINVAAEYFDVKPRVASLIYDKLDEMAAAEIAVSKLGGLDSVVLTEMYPECLNRLSPDTTDQPHIHPILMIADTKHVPTQYRLHIMKEHLKKKPNVDGEYMKSEVDQVLENITEPGSFLVSGSTLPPIEGAHALSQLTQNCDMDMQRFLTNRVWSQALLLCNASRDICKGLPSLFCAAQVQRYLDVSLYRLRFGDGFFEHMLNIIAEKFTEKYDICTEE